MRRSTRLVTAVAPVVLVPAAWVLAGAAVFTPLVTDRTFLVALVVMDVLLAGFYLATRRAMVGLVLGRWRRILVAGLLANLVGTVGLLVVPGERMLLAVPLYAWMVLPGLGYVRTYRMTERGLSRTVYLLAAAGSVGGAVLYAVAPLSPVETTTMALVGLGCVGVGQTVGIVTAAVGNLRGS